jgi:biopolymer transport protein ExbD
MIKEYRLRETGEVVTEEQYRGRFPELSLPETLSPQDADYIHPISPPEVGQYEYFIPDGIKQNSEGLWEYAYLVLSLPQEEIDHAIAVEANRVKGEKKAARAAAVFAITVTTQAGNVFDGDEMSQNRMARAILALQSTGTPNTNWVLADNSVIEATVAELSEALALAGAKQTELWIVPS